MLFDIIQMMHGSELADCLADWLTDWLPGKPTTRGWITRRRSPSATFLFECRMKDRAVSYVVWPATSLKYDF